MLEVPTWRSRLHGATVLELGAGTGLAGLAASVVVGPTGRVVLTDKQALVPGLLKNIKANSDKLGGGTFDSVGGGALNLSAAALEWGEEGLSECERLKHADVIIGADLMYDETLTR